MPGPSSHTQKKVIKVAKKVIFRENVPGQTLYQSYDRIFKSNELFGQDAVLSVNVTRLANGKKVHGIQYMQIVLPA